MHSPPPLEATPLTSSGSPAAAGLPPKLIDDAAKRLSIVAVVLVIVVVMIQIIERFAQPNVVPIMDNPINRLVLLASVGAGFTVGALLIKWGLKE